MTLINRVCNRIFKSTLRVTIDYHAGGFFIKKIVLYLLFLEKGKAILFDREEGGSPLDSNNEILLQTIQNEGTVLDVIQPNETVNILKLFNLEQEILCIPSVFMENIKQETLTEIILDNKKELTSSVLNLYLEI